MPSFRSRKMWGGHVVVLVVIICCFVDISSAGIYLDIPQEQATNTVSYRRPVRLMEERSVSDSRHGRTLIFKSLILAPLAMIVFILLLVLLIPIPVISNGRMFPSSAAFPTMQMARDVLTAEECVERVSCELSKISRSYESSSWIPSTLERFLTRSKLNERIMRGLESSSLCAQFTCSPAKTIKRAFKLE